VTENTQELVQLGSKGLLESDLTCVYSVEIAKRDRGMPRMLRARSESCVVAE
jgi:hypothetical protein